MWPKSYKNYPKDQSLKKEKVNSGDGIVGCEMHEINGWGSSYHVQRPRRRGVIYYVLEKLLGGRR